MKFHISRILLVMALAASSVVTAHARECADSTIKGTYAFTIHGQILTPGGPLLVDGIAKTTFDGDGELTQVSAVAINGNIPLIWSPSTGTYTVNADCTGTMTLISTKARALGRAGHLSPRFLFVRPSDALDGVLLACDRASCAVKTAQSVTKQRLSGYTTRNQSN